ncbi:MAG: AGE family epimerase/isomerase [Balneolales bacterium]
MKYILFILIALISEDPALAQIHYDAEDHREQLESIHEWMTINSQAVFNFWNEKSAINNAEDGFYGDINIRGHSFKGQRNSIQQARQLFTISVWYRLGEPSVNDALTAYNQFRYFIRDFHDPEGGEFFIEDIHKEENVPDRRLYNNSFAIYGLAHYFLAFRDHEEDIYRKAAREALAIAFDTFIAMDLRAHDDEYLGYQQIPINGLAENEVRLDGGDKEINTHLHIMEALTTLYEAWSLDDEVMKSELTSEQIDYLDDHLYTRLEEILVDVIVNRFCMEKGEYAYCRTEFERDWTLANDTYLNFAHDIETAWLFLEALRVMGDKASDPEPVITMAEKLIKTVYTYGFEQVESGYASVAQGNISDFSIRNDTKNMWQQFEAFAGLYHGVRLSESKDRQLAYLTRLTEVLSYIGGIKVTFNDTMWEFPQGNNLADEWKGGYHTLRALLFVKEWIEQDLDIETTSSLNMPDQPREFRLNQNYPNPFNPSTRITYELEQSDDVLLEVFDIQGRSVALLENGYKLAGQNTSDFYAKHLAGGIYIYRLTSGSDVISRKMILLK